MSFSNEFTNAITDAIHSRIKSALASAANSTISAVGKSAKSSAAEALAKTLIGMKEDAAQTRCRGLFLKCRVTSRDNTGIPCTPDSMNNRINLHIKNGIVSRAYVG